jgi:creatinine amidohydrolase/Fe(II)-dependent formamide hydrolase-like protein
MDMTWQEVAGAETGRWIAVLPLAAVEQHGPHLPLGVDTYIGEGYLERVGEILPDDLPVSFLPLQRIGVSAEPGARRRAQASADHQPRRQCRGDGNRGARSAHAA